MPGAHCQATVSPVLTLGPTAPRCLVPYPSPAFGPLDSVCWDLLN